MKQNPILEKILTFIQNRRLLVPGDRTLLSVSAGKDSMAMTDILYRIKNELGFSIALFHLNHRTRGRESDEDEYFLGALAEKKGIRLFTERHDFSVHGVSGGSFEDEAREIRYEMLHRIAEREGYTKIATAHTKTDAVETILMRLFTGTGIHGLTGIPATRGIIIRPLLPIDSGEIMNYLEDAGIPWREDSSNSDTTYTRNYIRHRVVPAIKERFPNYESAMAGTMNIADETLSLLNDSIVPLFGIPDKKKGDLQVIDASQLLCNPGLFNHVIAGMLRDSFGLYPSRKILAEIRGRAETEKTNLVLYEKGSARIVKAFRNGRPAIIARKHATTMNLKNWEYRVRIDEAIRSGITIPELAIRLLFSLTDTADKEDGLTSGNSVIIALPEGTTDIVIRNRRIGDRITLESGTKKIKDFFIEKKLDNENKSRVPLLIVGSRIAAVMPGFVLDLPNRIALPFLVSGKPEKVLAITMVNHYTKDGE